jgi:septal ring factor EnvC (AmiA/AmiB activator)
MQNPNDLTELRQRLAKVRKADLALRDAYSAHLAAVEKLGRDDSLFLLAAREPGERTLAAIDAKLSADAVELKRLDREIQAMHDERSAA